MNVARMRKAMACNGLAATWRGPRRALLGCLLGLSLLAAMPSGVAWAATPEMRGEWRLVSKSESATVEGIAIISQEANAKGEFAASEVKFLGVDPGTFTGTIKGTEASVVLTAEASAGFPASEFKSESIQIQESAGSLVLTGPGTVTQGSSTASATLTATRVKTYAEVVERQEREQHELEEAVARRGIRGEWTLSIAVGAQATKGVAFVTQEANRKNEFASSRAQFENGVVGSFTGVLEGAKATVTIATQATGAYPAVTFTSSSMTVNSANEPTSMSGTGTVESGGMSVPATLTATRTESYAQLLQAEALEREAAEKREKEAREALEREARGTAERQAKERAEQEAVGHSPAPTVPASAGSSSGEQPASSVLPTKLTASRLLVTRSGLVSLPLSNPGPLAVRGRVTLLLSGSSHKHGKSKSLVLASAAFSISPTRHVSVAVRLSKAGRSLLARRGTLRVAAVVSTKSASQTAVSKTYTLTLRVSQAHPR